MQQDRAAGMVARITWRVTVVARVFARGGQVQRGRVDVVCHARWVHLVGHGICRNETDAHWIVIGWLERR
jgi:hypothetical protein